MDSRPRIAPSLTPDEAPPETPPSLEPAAEPVAKRKWRVGTWLKRIFWTLFFIGVLIGLTPPTLVFWLRSHAPSTTAFMMQSEVQPVQYHWVPATQIPEALRLAVIASEDQKFRTHWGFDFYAIAEALEHNEKSPNRKRGASTITQQTAKNLFLWPSRSWLRKGLEVTFTLLLEGELSKDRILEIYLNIVELGPGIYGAEAAAQKFFHKSADKLTPAECAQLAAVLPNPRKWHADRPGPYVQTRVDWILGQIGQRPRFSVVPTEEEPVEPEAPAEDSGDNAADSSEATPPPATTEPGEPAPSSEPPAPSENPPADNAATLPADPPKAAPQEPLRYWQ